MVGASLKMYSDCMDELFVTCGSCLGVRNQLKCVCTERSNTWMGQKRAEGQQVGVELIVLH